MSMFKNHTSKGIEESEARSQNMNNLVKSSFNICVGQNSHQMILVTYEYSTRFY